MLKEVYPAFGVTALVLGLIAGCGTADTASDGHATKACGKVVLDGGGGIVQPADGSLAPECGAGACNYQSRAGCGDTQTCLPALSDDTLVATCRDAGASAEGAECDSSAACGIGAACEEGHCHKLCCAGDWSVCDAGESCYRDLQFKIGDAIVPTGTGLCYPVGTCSVLDPTGCDETGEDCKVVDSRGSEACMPKTGGALGEACGASQNRLCGRGLTCVGEPGAETCRRFCRAESCGEPACPAAEGTCVHFDRDPAGVGECTPGW